MCVRIHHICYTSQVANPVQPGEGRQKGSVMHITGSRNTWQKCHFILPHFLKWKEQENGHLSCPSAGCHSTNNESCYSRDRKNQTQYNATSILKKLYSKGKRSMQAVVSPRNCKQYLLHWIVFELLKVLSVPSLDLGFSSTVLQVGVPWTLCLEDTVLSEIQNTIIPY